MTHTLRLLAICSVLAPLTALADPEADYNTYCGICHDGAVKKAPARLMISIMPPEAIYKSLEEGLMREEAAALSSSQKRALAEHLSGAAFGTSEEPAWPRCEDALNLDTDGTSYSNWGFDLGNTRSAPAAEHLRPGDAASLEPLWAIRFPSANRARSQPLMTGDALIVGGHDGSVYAFDQMTGCHHWTFNASGEVRTGITYDADNKRAYFGDVLGNVYGIDAQTGNLIWRQRADEHPNATITGTPTFYGGTLYVPVSALEVSMAADPAYECCTFRGSVVAYNGATGEQRWKTFTITEAPSPQYKNRAGAQMYGPSGAVIWNSPAIDTKRGQLYVGTGENSSSPATPMSDAILAIDLENGEIRWAFQATPNDAWNVACMQQPDDSCPPENGPDYDFGAAAMLVETKKGELVIAGQKSGVVHALNPDTGDMVWQRKVGRGGIQGGIHFGSAAADGRVYVPISDMPVGGDLDHPLRPGMHALDAATGMPIWYAPIDEASCKGRSFCYPGISQAISVAGDLVFAGAMDGVLRVHDATTGSVLYEFDSTREFTTLNGEVTHGGSFGGAAGPVIANGLVVISSGYGIYDHMPGNLMMVFRVGAAATPTEDR